MSKTYHSIRAIRIGPNGVGGYGKQIACWRQPTRTKCACYLVADCEAITRRVMLQTVLSIQPHNGGEISPSLSLWAIAFAMAPGKETDGPSRPHSRKAPLTLKLTTSRISSNVGRYIATNHPDPIRL